MPSTRSKSIANNTAALADHGILCRVRKLEGTVSRLQRMMRNNGCSQNGIDGANGRDGAPVLMVQTVSNTRFRVSGGGYSVLFKPVLTQKRGVDHLDWTFFTVMKLVACQVTMELI